MTPATLVRRVCAIKECGRLRWRPYSWNYCPRHFIDNAVQTDKVSWVRDRFHGVLNGSTSHLGPVDWGPGDYTRDELVDLYSELPLARIDPTREAQWNNSDAREAALVSPAGRRRANPDHVKNEVARINRQGN